MIPKETPEERQVKKLRKCFKCGFTLTGDAGSLWKHIDKTCQARHTHLEPDALEGTYR